MLFIRINNTGERVTIPLIKDMRVKDIILALGDIQYPYKLDFCGKILDENPESLISDFNINDESTIFLFNTYKSDIKKLNNDILSLNNEIMSLKNINDNEKNINNQKHLSELSSLNNEIASLRNINIQQNQRYISEINSLSGSKNHENNLLNDQIKYLKIEMESIKSSLEHEKMMTRTMSLTIDYDKRIIEKIEFDLENERKKNDPQKRRGRIPIEKYKL